MLATKLAVFSAFPLGVTIIAGCMRDVDVFGLRKSVNEYSTFPLIHTVNLIVGASCTDGLEKVVVSHRCTHVLTNDLKSSYTVVLIARVSRSA